MPLALLVESEGPQAHLIAGHRTLPCCFVTVSGTAIREAPVVPVAPIDLAQLGWTVAGESLTEDAARGWPTLTR